jgi:glycosyltransferase involved in cell wall biosynthesis
MNPKITIAIPVYNVEKYIERSLISALNQTYNNLEIIVIDDKGKDSSMQIVKETVSQHPKGNIVKIIDHKVNQGTGATKNTAIAESTGEYLMFMDSDDYISEDCVEKHFMAIKDYDMTVGSYVKFDNNGTIEGQFKYDNRILKGNNPLHHWFFAEKNWYIPTWNKLYRLSLLRDNNVWCIPSNRNEDVFFAFQLLKHVKSIAFVRDITYYHNIGNPQSTMAQTTQEKFHVPNHYQYVDILRTMIEYMNRYGLLHDFALNDYFWRFAYIRLITIFSNKILNSKEKMIYMKDIMDIKPCQCSYLGVGKKLTNFKNNLLFNSAPSLAYFILCVLKVINKKR